MTHPTPITCPACEKTNSHIIAKGFPGYVQDTTFDIAECPDCNLSFIYPLKTEKWIYDAIYNQQAVPGYDRYWQFSQTVKKKTNPLKYLAQQTMPYKIVAEYLEDQPPLRILDVGCGYGYLTYALRQAGHNVVGIDISSQAIATAKKIYGGEFYAASLEGYAKNQPEPFDLIIALEVVEHLTNLETFMVSARKLLEPGGAILFTTPSKNYRPKGTVWRQELPPVHTLFFTEQSFERLAKQLGYSARILNPKIRPSVPTNLLAHYLFIHFANLQQPSLDRLGIPLASRNQFPTRRALIALTEWAPIRFVSNCLYLIFKRPPQNMTLTVVLEIMN